MTSSAEPVPGDNAYALARIVLVEDHPQLRTMYERFLRDSGDIDVVAACANAADGIDAAARLQPDAVLIDLSLPDMRGVDAIALLLGKAPSTRVIVVSGADAVVAAPEVEAAGAAAYVDKIDVTKELLPTIRRVLAK